MIGRDGCPCDQAGFPDKAATLWSSRNGWVTALGGAGKIRRMTSSSPAGSKPTAGQCPEPFR